MEVSVSLPTQPFTADTTVGFKDPLVLLAPTATEEVVRKSQAKLMGSAGN